MSNLAERQKPGRLTHTASSVFWHEEPSGILTVPAPDSTPPANTRAASAMSLLELAANPTRSKDPDAAHLPGILDSAPRSMGPRPDDPLWAGVEDDFRARMESTRPSIRPAMARVLLSLVGQWERTGDERFLQGVDFNRLPRPRKAGESLLPSRSALIRATSTSQPAVTNSPRFRPTPEELTAGRMDYEGMCEVLWSAARAPEFECWRSAPARRA